MLTLEYLKNRLSYDPITGLFNYLMPIANMQVGELAGTPNTNGHIQIMINGEFYLAHTLAWFYMTGEWPVGYIDHKDLNKGNNAWVNLRKATLSQNQGNVGLRLDNISGYKGVHYDKRKDKFIAQITIDGKRTYLGARKLAKEAYELYCIAAKEHFGEFHRDNS